MKIAKRISAVAAAVVVASSAYAVPTITISDGIGAPLVVANASGVVTLTTSDAAWQVVVSTGITKPAAGSATSPFMDLNIQAVSLNGAIGANNLVITFSETGFGPTSGSFLAQLSGHLISGSGQNVTYSSFYRTDNALQPPVGTLLTTTGALPGPNYSTAVTSGSLSLGNPYSLAQQVTIVSGGGASYSLDASLVTVPDGGTTVMLLGSVLAAFGVARRYWKS